MTRSTAFSAVCTTGIDGDYRSETAREKFCKTSIGFDVTQRDPELSCFQAAGSRVAVFARLGGTSAAALDIPKSDTMMAAPPPKDLQVTALRTRLTGALPLMMQAAIEPFDDDSIWWQPAAGVNPVAVLALHCAGNLRHFIGRHIAGTDYVRNRPEEFDASRRLTKREILDELERAIDEVRLAMDSLTTEDYAAPSRDPDGRHWTVYEDFLNATVHLALHVGQAVQLAKLKGYKLSDRVWGEAHAASGASRV
jgi:hypothetical protein